MRLPTMLFALAVLTSGCRCGEEAILPPVDAGRDTPAPPDAPDPPDAPVAPDAPASLDAPADAGPAPMCTTAEPCAWHERSPATRPPTLAWAAMAFDDARDEMILFGGAGSITGGGQTDRTWAWNGTTWAERSPSTRPTARWTHAMAYDPEREVVVLFGGLADDGATPLDDTWEWDGTDWTEVTTANAPSPRGVHGAMTWDGARHTILLRGGGTVPGSTIFDDTWEYDGTDWTEIVGAGPSARIAPAVAFDEVRGETVLFGGGTWSPYFGDTWTLERGVWTELAPTESPSARQSARAVFEPTRGVVLLFGGADDAFLSDLWEWDGTTWTDLAVTGPPPRCCYAFAHDRARAETVLFGGPDDATWVYGRD